MDYSTPEPTLFATPTAASTAANVTSLIFGSLIVLALMVLAIILPWRIYRKAGQPGWATLIPFYNIYVFLKIVGRPGWWLILFLIPVINLIVSLIIAVDLAKSFGRSSAFGIVGLWLFSLIGIIILAFGKDTYVGPSAAPMPAQQPVAPTEPPAPAAV